MATHFGEVIFPSSRAFWDDNEDDEFNDCSESKSKLTIRWLKNMPKNIKKLLFIEGEAIIGIIKECLYQNIEEVCVIDDELSKKIIIGYEINESTFLFIISTKFNAKYSGDFIDMIFEMISDAQSTASITCQHVSSYKGTDIPQGRDSLRILCTAKASEGYKEIKKLQQPNIISGVTAGVLSCAEIIKRPSALYVLYTDSFTLDTESMELLLKLLSDVTTTPLHKITSAGQNFFTKGNLYM